MAIKITDECINCGACEPECPNTAIYEGGAEWKFSQGTSLKGSYKRFNTGIEVDANADNEPVDMDIYFIVTDKCPSVKDFMMNLNVLQYVLLTVVSQMRTG